jgi:hypothetical protein
VWVDVLLEPSRIPVTARLQLGVGGARCQIVAPIRPGDEVLVVIPDGNLMNPPAIVAILNSMSAQVGQTAGRSVFKNDRLLVYSDGFPVEVEARDADVTFVTNRDVKIGGRNAGEPLVLGNRWKSRMEKLYQDLAAHKHASAVGPTSPPLAPELLEWTANQPLLLPADISDDNFTKKKNDGT